MVLHVCKAGGQVSSCIVSQLKREAPIHSHSHSHIGMEDSHTTITSYADTGASFFAVFDGHGGSFYI